MSLWLDDGCRVPGVITHSWTLLGGGSEMWAGCFWLVSQNNMCLVMPIVHKVCRQSCVFGLLLGFTVRTDICTCSSSRFYITVSVSSYQSLPPPGIVLSVPPGPLYIFWLECFSLRSCNRITVNCLVMKLSQWVHSVPLLCFLVKRKFISQRWAYRKEELL